MGIVISMQCWRGRHQYRDKNLRMEVIKEAPDKTLFEIENTCIRCGKTRHSRAWIPNRRERWD